MIENSIAGDDPEPGRKILFLTSSMHGGGAERVASLLCNEWAEQGHFVTLMPTYSARGDCVYPLHPKVRLRFLADLLPKMKRNPLSMLLRLLALRRFIKGTKPDLVISFLTHVNVATLISIIGLRQTAVVSERTYPPSRSLGVFWETARKLMYPRAHTVVMQTGDGLRWLQDQVPSANGTVIANPVVHPLPQSRPYVSPEDFLPPEKTVVLAVGRMTHEKRFDFLIDSFAKSELWKKNAVLVIVGDGPDRPLLVDLAKQFELGSSVVLPGRVGNLSDWFSRASVFTMTSKYEGFPNALLEALVAGLYCVSLDIKTGPKELIDCPRKGVLVAETCTADEFGAVLRNSLAQSSGLQTGVIRQEMLDKYEISRISEQWLKLLAPM